MQRGEVEGGDVEDDSLLTFEEDLEFDPLKRSDSVHRANSLSLKSTPPTSSSSFPSQPALLEPQVQPPPSTIVPVARGDSSSSLLNPVTSTTTGNKDLAGISLETGTTSLTGHATQKPQDSLSQLLYSVQTTPSSNAPPQPLGMTIAPSSVGVVTSYPQGMLPMVSAPSGTLGGQVQVPLGLQGGVVYGAGMVPVVYAPQAPQGVMYMNQVSNLSNLNVILYAVFSPLLILVAIYAFIMLMNI